MSIDRLRRFYARLADDPAFVAGHIALSELADILDADVATAVRVGLCRMPAARGRDAWLTQLSERFGIPRERLEALLTRIGAP